MLRWVGRSTVVVVVVAVLALTAHSADSMAAHPYANAQSGALVYVTNIQGFTLNDRDGVYAEAVVAPAMAAAPIPGTQYTYANLRPIQVASTQPQLSRDNAEFIGIGYGIGCLNVAGCTGIYKRQYYDGGICNGSWSCRYTAAWRTAVSVGERRAYQIQRKYTGSVFEWRLFFNGSTAFVALRPQMTHTLVALGSENAQTEGAGHANVTMQQDYFAVYVHGNGAASTNPPGVTNMSPARGSPYSPHAPQCTAAIDPGLYNNYRITGSC